VKISDWFKPKSNAPKGLVRLDVEFTADENEAMGGAIERFDAVVMNAHAPEGTRMFSPPKSGAQFLLKGWSTLKISSGKFRSPVRVGGVDADHAGPTLQQRPQS
jgi:hypothetical protein